VSEGEQVANKMFPDAEPNFGIARALTFWNNTKVPLVWINSDLVKGKQKILTACHESYHLVKYLENRIPINDEEWFAETLEYVVKQIKENN